MNSANVCPCGCQRSVRQGKLYARPDCYARWRKQQAPALSTIKCATCDRMLSAKDVTQRVVRCATCRRLRPGHVPATLNRYGRRGFIGAVGAKPKPAPSDSWWMTAPREGFTAAARQRDSANVKMPIAYWPGGDCA